MNILFPELNSPFCPSQAVKKSREKSKQHAKETQDRVDKLKNENEKLRQNIRTVHKNLQTLKTLFINATGSKKQTMGLEMIRELIKEIDDLDTLESEESSEEDEDDDVQVDDETEEDD